MLAYLLASGHMCLSALPGKIKEASGRKLSRAGEVPLLPARRSDSPFFLLSNLFGSFEANPVISVIQGLGNFNANLMG